jgi:Fe-S-cluster-containing dehydrogenase component
VNDPLQTTKPEDPESTDIWLPGEDVGTSRRTFLRLAGFGVASAGLAGCSRSPARAALIAPHAQTATTPGVPYWVATTCEGCSAGCGVLARCRDGRPIKLEGNPSDSLSGGGLCAVGQGQVLSLYDALRPKGPAQGEQARTWTEADAALQAELTPLRSGGKLRLLSGTITSPSTRAWIERFLANFADGEHIEVDPCSWSAGLEAHARTHGVRALPHLRLDRARVVGSFGADPLGTGLSPVEHAAAWARGRKPEAGPLSKWWQFEALTSLTGGVSDRRLRLAPWQTRSALAGLVDALGKLAGTSTSVDGALAEAPHAEALRELAAELWQARGQAVVLVGGNDLQAWLLCNLANELLGAYGELLDLAYPSLQARGDDDAARTLARELGSGEVDFMLVAGLNPAYERPDLAPYLAQAGTLVVTSMAKDETSALAHWHLPEPHPLESWGDAEPVAGQFALRQPTVPRLFNGRTLRATLAKWSGDPRGERELVEAHLAAEVHPRVAPEVPFETFLIQTRRDGWVSAPATGAASPSFDPSAVQAPTPVAPPAELGLVLYEKVGLRTGAHAQNPWLQELPDPISRITWDNYACLSPTRAETLDLEEGDLVRLSTAELESTLELPVHVQPGQHDDVVAVALGYGRLGTDRFANIGPDWLEGHPTVAKGGTIGVSAADWLDADGDHLRRDTRAVSLTRAKGQVKLACLQDYHRLELPAHLAPKGAEVRDNLRLADAEGQMLGHGGHHGTGENVDLWPDDHPRPGHAWAMTIDLSACTGCSACVVGCQVENNVPVVGRDEVARHREMHWIRLDRYYRGDDDSLAVSHQPMLCQHCDNAPCEAVCPVLATVHSSEGLNQQIYNRCVGTRYCANTCPYKVRRFNWFEYPRDDETANHALNPDVVVRERGVMEKCSFCAQRIQEAKGAARREGRPIADGEIQTACQQSCPTHAITFGDLSDPESAVSKAMALPRAYRVLEELNVKPSIGYLAEARHQADHGTDHQQPESADAH